MKSNLKKLRKSLNLTLDNLGMLCGSSKSYLHGLEKGGHELSLRKAYEISAVFGLRVQDIWPSTVKVKRENTFVNKVIKRRKQKPA